MNLKPLGDRLVVKVLAEVTKTKGGIVLPDTAQEKPQEAEVIAVGPGKKLENGKVEPLDIKVKDKVLFAKYAGTEVKVEGDDYLIISESDILATVS